MADLLERTSSKSGYDIDLSKRELPDRDDDGRPLRTGTLFLRRYLSLYHIIHLSAFYDIVDTYELQNSVHSYIIFRIACQDADLSEIMSSRNCMDRIRAHHHRCYWLRSALFGLEYGSAGLDCRALSAAVICSCHLFHISSSGRLLQVSQLRDWEAQLHLHGCCQSKFRRAPIAVCGVVQYSNLIGTAIGYTITSSISMVAINRSNCFHKKGKNSVCHVSNNPYMILFGLIEIILSQIPDFNKLWWLSIVAAIMSISYASIGLGLGVGKATETGHSYGTLDGVSVEERSQKVWLVFQALGDVAFAYAFSMILIEIQDTIKNPPPENRTMKKATLLGVCTTTVFYMLSGCIGYAAFGNDAPGNLLTGFGFYNPFWLIDLANACIVVHLIGAYQVFTQPVYAFVENWVKKLCPKSNFIHKEHVVTIPKYGPFPVNLFRLVWRTAFVVFTTLVAMLLPFFNDILGILGATAFWPLTVYFPIEMYIAQMRIGKWTREWIALETVSMICLVISLAGLIGSIEGVVNDLKVYKPFKTEY
ncbi:hypothetical protein L7F22_003858 [Adiantum nelumboides]|nr:hypothetical protein [Adiantum nelumboides]